jgi:hypothetical protein
LHTPASPSRSSASHGIGIGAFSVALLGTILLTGSVSAASTSVSLGAAAPFAILAGDAITKVPTPGTGATAASRASQPILTTPNTATGTPVSPSNRADYVGFILAVIALVVLRLVFRAPSRPVR